MKFLKTNSKLFTTLNFYVASIIAVKKNKVVMNYISICH